MSTSYRLTSPNIVNECTLFTLKEISQCLALPITLFIMAGKKTERKKMKEKTYNWIICEIDKLSMMI